MSNCKEVFSDIYARKVWGDGSGGGSGEQAKPYIDFINTELAKESGTLLDIGFGDRRICNEYWLRGWFLEGVEAAPNPEGDQLVEPRYRGAGTPGAVEPICARLRYDFDALTDELPAADLVLCKEVMQHLSNAQVQLLLDRTAHYPRRLFCNTMHPSLGVNTDIETGDTRAVDLTLAPFNQPAKTVFRYGCWHIQEL